LFDINEKENGNRNGNGNLDMKEGKRREEPSTIVVRDFILIIFGIG
jgi:hypothetical protein